MCLYLLTRSFSHLFLFLLEQLSSSMKNSCYHNLCINKCINSPDTFNQSDLQMRNIYSMCFPLNLLYTISCQSSAWFLGHSQLFLCGCQDLGCYQVVVTVFGSCSGMFVRAWRLLGYLGCYQGGYGILECFQVFKVFWVVGRVFSLFLGHSSD